MNLEDSVRISNLEDEVKDQQRIIKNLVMLIMRFCRKHKDTQHSIGALDYLKRENLLPSPLRKSK